MYRMMTMTFAVVGLLALLAPTESQAQPAGDYAQTCRDIRTNGSWVQARCQTRDGGWRDTSLDYSRCVGPVINNDGNLYCQQGYSQGGWQGGLPSGDYQQTCQDVRTNGSVLEARCQKRDGGWRNTSLDYRRCSSTIVNDDGRLYCEQSGGSNWSGNIPSGSYSGTCQDVRSNGAVLEARCRTASGDWQRTSLDYRTCGGGDIVNSNGHLRCGGDGSGHWAYPGDGAGAIPGGWYSQSCDNIRTSGDRLEARCQTANGDWRTTTLDNFQRCRGDIVNQDGRLSCPR